MFKAVIFRICAILASFLVVFVWGCGYSSRSKAFEHIDSVTISPLDNETVDYLLDDDL